MAGGDEKLILYGDKDLASPYVMSVAVALAEKGLPYELKRIDLSRKENLDDTYRTRSLTARVPSLSTATLAFRVLRDRRVPGGSLPPPKHARSTRAIRGNAHARGRSKPGCAATSCPSASSATPRWCSSARA